MPEPFEPQSDAPFVCFGANVFDGVDGSDFEIVFFPQNAAMDVADGNISLVRFADELLPIGLAFFERTFACPNFFDWKRFDDGKGSAKMILVGVRNNQRVKFADTSVMQEGDDDVFAGIDFAVVACIDEKVPARWCFDKVAVALPDIDGGERPRWVQNVVVTVVRKNDRREQ